MIEVSHVTKRYGDLQAVDDVSFTVRKGSICGLLGPNGAGKSTTMNVMTGCLAASSGEVWYDGLEIYENKSQVKKMIGYLPEQPPLYPDMTVWEYLAFVAHAKGIEKSERESEMRRVSRECGVSDVQTRLVKSLSKGYKQRVGIAQALLGDPSVVILDEPTVGLDPIQIIEIRSLVKRLGARRTVIVSSHILSEIRALCDQIVIIAHGRVVADDAPEELERTLAGPAVTTIRARAEEGALHDALASVDGIERVEFVPSKELGTTEVRVSAVQGVDIREQAFRALSEASVPVVELSTRRPSLEDVFVALAQGDASPVSDDASLAQGDASPVSDDVDPKGGDAS